jgi:hypothetical protein
MIRMLFLSKFVGNVPGDALGRYRDRISHADFFRLHAGLAVGSPMATVPVARSATRFLAPRSAGDA